MFRARVEHRGRGVRHLPRRECLVRRTHVFEDCIGIVPVLLEAVQMRLVPRAKANVAAVPRRPRPSVRFMFARFFAAVAMLLRSSSMTFSGCAPRSNPIWSVIVPQHGVQRLTVPCDDASPARWSLIQALSENIAGVWL